MKATRIAALAAALATTGCVSAGPSRHELEQLRRKVAELESRVALLEASPTDCRCIGD